MYKFTLFFVLFLPPLSIRAQTDSFKVVQFYDRIKGIPDSTIAGFTISYEDDFAFYSFKIDNTMTADSVKKGLLSDFHKEKMNKIRENMKRKQIERDSTLKVLINTPIPDFDARDTMGLVHRPANYRGRVLLLHFFNFWDSSFDNEIPVLNNLMERYNAKGLEILSFMDIGITDSERKWLKEKPINFPLITDARLFMRKFLPVTKQTPYVVLVDKAGNFRYFYLKGVINANKRQAANGKMGEKERLITFDDWEEKIVHLLEESKF
jgi:peroxiredoxin